MVQEGTQAFENRFATASGGENFVRIAEVAKMPSKTVNSLIRFAKGDQRRPGYRSMSGPGRSARD
jgi:hypothetical protein